MVEIEFSDGQHKTIDIRPFIGHGISAALKDEAYFRQVSLEDGGGIAWPNGYDFCPSFLHDDVPAAKASNYTTKYNFEQAIYEQKP